MWTIINYESHTHKKSRRGKTGNITQMGISAAGSDVQGHLISDARVRGVWNGVPATTSPVLEVVGTM